VKRRRANDLPVCDSNQVLAAERSPHAVRLHPEQQVEGVVRSVLEVVGPVLAGGAVQIGRADFFHGLEIIVVKVFAAVEHEVLEEVGETGFAGLLVLRADMIPDVDGDDGGFVVLIDQKREPVLQNEFFVRNVDLFAEVGGLGGGGKAGNRQSCQ
jgi:hypothetical protein